MADGTGYKKLGYVVMRASQDVNANSQDREFLHPGGEWRPTTRGCERWDFEAAHLAEARARELRDRGIYCNHAILVLEFSKATAPDKPKKTSPFGGR